MRPEKRLSVLLVFFSCTLAGVPIPFYPASQTTCQYLLSGARACAFRDQEDSYYLSHARGIRISYQNNDACLMRITTSNPDLLPDKPLRSVSQYSDPDLYHIWWLEMDSGQLIDLDCLNASSETESVPPGSALLFSENAQDEPLSGWEYPQGYCVMKNDGFKMTLGLTDTISPHICQAFDSQLQGVYGNTLQKVLIDTGSSTAHRFRRSDTEMNNPQPTGPRDSIPVGFSWSDLGTKLLIFCVVASVFPTMVMTAHTKCCSRR